MHVNESKVRPGLRPRSQAVAAARRTYGHARCSAPRAISRGRDRIVQERAESRVRRVFVAATAASAREKGAKNRSDICLPPVNQIAREARLRFHAFDGGGDRARARREDCSPLVAVSDPYLLRRFLRRVPGHARCAGAAHLNRSAERPEDRRAPPARPESSPRVRRRRQAALRRQAWSSDRSGRGRRAACWRRASPRQPAEGR